MRAIGVVWVALVCCTCLGCITFYPENGDRDAYAFRRGQGSEEFSQPLDRVGRAAAKSLQEMGVRDVKAEYDFGMVWKNNGWDDKATYINEMRLTGVTQDNRPVLVTIQRPRAQTHVVARFGPLGDDELSRNVLSRITASLEPQLAGDQLWMLNPSPELALEQFKRTVGPPTAVAAARPADPRVVPAAGTSTTAH